LSQKVNRWCIFATLIGGAILIAGEKLKNTKKFCMQEKMRLLFLFLIAHDRILNDLCQGLLKQQAPFLLQFHNFGI
jgi:hypothetical protein